ncbi:HDIG domain-containing protein [bacterium]|nr:MAG: HDIG domain-containing protein [bacterium]
MKILELIGLSPKPKSYVGIGESQKEAQKKEIFEQRKDIAVKVLIGLVFFSFLIFIFPRSTFQEINYKLGEPWTQEDLTAPFTFSLLKDADEYDKEKDQIVRETPLIFHVDHDTRIRIVTRIDSLFSRIDPVLKAYIKWQTAKAEKNTEDMLSDSLQFIQSRFQSGVGLDEKGWNGLLDRYSFNSTKPKSDRFIGVDIRLRLDRLIDELLNQGIIDRTKSEITLQEITVRDLRQRTERNQYLVDVKDIREAREYAQYRLFRTFADQSAESAYQLFNLVIESNLIFSAKDTKDRVDEFISTISPTKGAVAKGQVIIRKGDLINRDRLNMLSSLAKARSEQASELEVWKQYIGQIIIMLAINFIFIMYIYLYRRKIFDDNKMFFLLFLLIGLIFAANSFIYRFENVSPYIVPVAIIPVILTVIFDSRVGILTTLIVSLTIGLYNGYDFELTTSSITACSIAVYSVRDIKNRSQFYLFTPALILTSYALVYIGFSLTKLGTFDNLYQHSISILINALFNLVMVYPLILIVEKLFNVTTDVTLLELSDTNRPLLKSLMLHASGTFHHSLQVANLSEAAANAIGANALLCRVGAMYHDIGKMEKPEYFVENQSGMNVHEKLKPRMSALVIREHVKGGVKMAEEHDLPEIIIDFIKTHHGTSLIRYFYEKGKQISENPEEIKEEDFRYDGPIPSTRETGIVMLADSVEASARTLKEPNYSKLEAHVHRIVDEKLDEGQLSDCPLTFQDLQRIKEAFLTILVGVYHGRVKYPGQDEEVKKVVLQNPESSLIKPAPVTKSTELKAPKKESKEDDNDDELNAII